MPQTTCREHDFDTSSCTDACERTVERCWDIKTQFPIRASVIGRELRVGEMTLAYDDFEHLMGGVLDDERATAYREGRSAEWRVTTSSYSYINGAARIAFEDPAPGQTVPRAKPTDIWTNLDIELPMCGPGRPDHEAAPRGAKTGTQGLKNAALRSRIPPRLAAAFADHIEERLR